LLALGKCYDRKIRKDLLDCDNSSQNFQIS
jgi:hypothetical protein